MQEDFNPRSNPIIVDRREHEFFVADPDRNHQDESDKSEASSDGVERLGMIAGEGTKRSSFDEGGLGKVDCQPGQEDDGERGDEDDEGRDEDERGLNGTDRELKHGDFWHCRRNREKGGEVVGGETVGLTDSFRCPRSDRARRCAATKSAIDISRFEEIDELLNIP